MYGSEPHPLPMSARISWAAGARGAAGRISPRLLDPALKQAALDELNNDCRFGDPFLRSNALEALSEVAPEAAQRPVLDALSDGEPNVRFAAAVGAGRLQIKLGVSPLLNMVQDPDLRVCAAVDFRLASPGGHAIQSQAGETRRQIRIRRCGPAPPRFWGLMHEPTARAVLVPMLFDHVAAVRLQAARRCGDWEMRTD